MRNITSFLKFATALLLIMVIGGYSAQAQSGGADVDVSKCIYADGQTPILFGGARPASLVIQQAPLLSQPPLTPDTQPLTIATLPVGAAVIVTDKDDQTKTYFRVIWPCSGQNFTGWVDINAVRRNPRRVNPKYAPPGCAHPIDTVNLLDGFWTSTVTGEIAVVVDLYRNEGGTDYPHSFYYLTVNGREIRDKDREFFTSGPFLITGVVMGVSVRRGQPVGFSILPPPTEPVNFFGIIYQVPDGCEFQQ